MRRRDFNAATLPLSRRGNDLKIGKREQNMPIDLTCSCGKLLRVADEAAGRQGRCPVCGALLEIPEREVPARGAGPSPLDATQA